MVTCTGHIGIHEGADGRTDVRTYNTAVKRLRMCERWSEKGEQAVKMAVRPRGFKL